ncbi:MAG: YbjN domain-containing protein [Bacteroidales bacterium]
MSKPLRQITNFLEQRGFTPEFDLDSHTLFLETPTPDGPVQTRFFYDLDMEVLSCQCIYMESLPKNKYSELSEMVNRFNEQLGFGAFVILEEEDLVFEINHLLDPNTQISEAILDKIALVPAEAMTEHLPSFLAVALQNQSPAHVFDRFWEE